MELTVLLFWLATVGIGLVLRYLNLRHLRTYGEVVPAGFEGEIDTATLQRSAAYTVARSRFGLVRALWDAVLLLVFFFGGLLPACDRLLAGSTGSFIGDGVVFFLALLFAHALLELPFDLWSTFRLEARFGFNTTTGGLWLADRLKELLLSLLLFGGLIAAALWLVQASPVHWWLWVWGLLSGTTLFLLVISPYLIEPLFFTFEPLRREGLEAGVRTLLEQAGLEVATVLQVDASRRSRHSNAYFTGIGRVKRIVLFDTLLAQLDDREVLAILAHEVGHWKHGHLAKRLAQSQVLTLGGCWLAWQALHSGLLPRLLGLPAVSFYAQLLILFFLAGIALFPFAPLTAWFSRRQEWQADRFATDLTGDPQALGSALVKLSRENLSNLHPHPLYAWYYYSHPPLVARIQRLQQRLETAGQQESPPRKERG
jgi:STE24 endopeptidase